MIFTINQLKTDSSYISKAADEIENNTLIQYYAFKKFSAVIFINFKKEEKKYGTVKKMPRDILENYSKQIYSLFACYKNLRDDLVRQLKNNIKETESMRAIGHEEAIIDIICKKKYDRLKDKIEYIDIIMKFQITLDYCLMFN